MYGSVHERHRSSLEALAAGAHLAAVAAAAEGFGAEQTQRPRTLRARLSADPELLATLVIAVGPRPRDAVRVHVWPDRAARRTAVPDAAARPRLARSLAPDRRPRGRHCRWPGWQRCGGAGALPPGQARQRARHVTSPRWRRLGAIRQGLQRRPGPRPARAGRAALRGRRRRPAGFPGGSTGPLRRRPVRDVAARSARRAGYRGAAGQRRDRRWREPAGSGAGLDPA